MISAVRRVLSSRFFRQSSTLQGAAVISAAGGFIGLLALTRILGPAELAVFIMASTCYSLLWSLLNLAPASVATSRIAASLRAGETDRMVGWVGILLRLSILLSGVALLVGAFALPAACERFIQLNGARIGFLSALMMMVPILDVPRIVCCSAMQAERKMNALARVDAGQELCRLVLVLSGALAFGTAIGPVIGTIISSVAGSLLALDAYRRERRAEDSVLPALGTAFRTRTVPANLAVREGAKVGVVRNVDQLGTSIFPTLFLGGVGNQEWVTYLRVAQRMITMTRLFMQGINRTALPALAQLAGVKDLVGLRRLYWRASFYSGGVVTLGLLVTLPFLPFLLRATLPPEYWDPVWLLALILAPGLAVVSFSVANDIFYLVTGQMRVAIILSVVGLVVNTALLTVLVHGYPRVGAAIGLTVTCCFSLAHVSYAWLWFRRNDHLFLQKEPEGQLPASATAP